MANTTAVIEAARNLKYHSASPQWRAQGILKGEKLWSFLWKKKKKCIREAAWPAAFSQLKT